MWVFLLFIKWIAGRVVDHDISKLLPYIFNKLTLKLANYAVPAMPSSNSTKSYVQAFVDAMLVLKTEPEAVTTTTTTPVTLMTTGKPITMGAYHNADNTNVVVDQPDYQKTITVVMPGVLQIRPPYDAFNIPSVILYNDDTYHLYRRGDILTISISSTSPGHTPIYRKSVQREVERLRTTLPALRCGNNSSLLAMKKRDFLLSRSRRRSGFLDSFLSTPLLEVDADVKTTSGNNFTLNSARNGTINHIQEGDTTMREIAQGASVHTNRIGTGDINSGSDSTKASEYMRLFADVLSEQKEKSATVSTATFNLQNPFMRQPRQFSPYPNPYGGFPISSTPNFYFPNQAMTPTFASGAKPDLKLSPDEEEKLFTRLYKRILSDIMTYLTSLQATTTRSRRDTDLDIGLLYKLINLTEEVETRPDPAHVRFTNHRGQYDIYHRATDGSNSTLNVSYVNGKMKIFSMGPDSTDLENSDPDRITFQYHDDEIVDNINSTRPRIEVNPSQNYRPRSIQKYLLLGVFIAIAFICFSAFVYVCVRYLHRPTVTSNPTEPPLILKTI